MGTPMKHFRIVPSDGYSYMLAGLVGLLNAAPTGRLTCEVVSRSAVVLHVTVRNTTGEIIVVETPDGSTHVRPSDEINLSMKICDHTEELVT